MSLRILVADDHPFYREGLKTLLAARAPHVDVVGEAATGEAAVELYAATRPDVVLMDLQMPGMGGIEATRLILAADPSAGVLVLTMHDDDSVLPALQAGARGYLLKDAGVDDVVRAIESVHAGQSVLAPQAAERVARRLEGSADASRPFPELTGREHDILALVVHGTTTVDIARRLGLSDKTVRNYVSNILTKLQARDRAHLVVKARDAGYPDAPGSGR